MTMLSGWRWSPWLLGVLSGLAAPQRPALSSDHAPPAQVPVAETAGEEEEAVPVPNLPTPTFGGTQFWTDELVFHNWRIQRNALVGHYRLLDDRDTRRAWGSFEQCLERLEELRHDLHLPPHRPQVVVVLHGLGRTRHSMEGLCNYVREHTDCTVLNVGYASTREGLNAHATALAKVIENLGDAHEVSLIAHSMGNIVTRRYLANLAANGHAPARVRRIVMLAPPNKGAQLARRFHDHRLFELFLGASGVELAQSAEHLERLLAVPSCEFGIIAGGTGDDAGRSPLLEGDDDFIVSVAETRLPGARDFAVVPAMHTVIMDNPTVQEYAVRFLQQGFFQSEDRRCPIPPPR